LTDAQQIIRISDLAKPRLSPAAEEALKAAESRAVELTVDSVLTTATRSSGLLDFGPGDFRRRLAVLLSEVENHPRNTAFGRAHYFDLMVDTAVARLRMINLFARHPEIHETKIVRPIFIVGMPRSGTTDLVNSLGSDSRFRTMPNWERMVVPDDPSNPTDPHAEDPRLTRARTQFEADRRLLPYRELMHPTNPYFLDEAPTDALDFPLSTWEGRPLAWEREMLHWRSDVPLWLKHDLASRVTPQYSWSKWGIQVLQWYRPAARFAGKATGMMGDVGAILQQFPDATIVFTHRDPVAILQSSATMICYRARLYYRSIDPAWYLEFYKGLIHDLLKAYLKNRAVVPEGQGLDILFHERIANPIGHLEKIYDLAGFPLTTQARREIATAGKSRARGFVPWNEGRVVYNLREDFSVDPNEIRREFSYYYDAVSVQPEVF
jgi:hypothetical protein